MYVWFVLVRFDSTLVGVIRRSRSSAEVESWAVSASQRMHRAKSGLAEIGLMLQAKAFSCLRSAVLAWPDAQVAVSSAELLPGFRHDTSLFPRLVLLCINADFHD